MSLTLDQAWTYRFHDQIHLQYQAMGSQLENLIAPEMVHRDIQAAIDHHERMGTLIANDVISPYGPTKRLNVNHSRRACTLQSSDATLLISDEDTLRSMVNPQSQYTRTIVAALGRRADLHIINASVGSAATAAVTSGSGVITYGSQAMLSAHKIGTGVAITLTNIIGSGVLLSKASCPTGPKERVFLYGPGQENDIMAITQASSSDFTKNRIHDSGTIDGEDWQGFHFVQIADVVDETTAVLQSMLPSTSATQRSCIAMSRGAVGLSIGRDIKTKIDELPETNHCIQTRAVMAMAAVRIWEGGVVQISVLEN